MSPPEEMSPTLGLKRSDWFKASFMGKRFSAWLQIRENQFIIRDF